MLGGGKVKELYELKGEGRSIRGIVRELGVSRNTVRKYARASGVPKPKPRAKRGRVQGVHRREAVRRTGELRGGAEGTSAAGIRGRL